MPNVDAPGCGAPAAQQQRADSVQAFLNFHRSAPVCS